MGEKTLSRSDKVLETLLALGNKIQPSDRDYPSSFHLIKWKPKFNDCFRSSGGKVSTALKCCYQGVPVPAPHMCHSKAECGEAVKELSENKIYVSVDFFV